MKKHLLLLMFMAMILSVSAGTITLQQQASEVRILSSSSEGLSVRFALDRIQHNEINTKEGVWTMLGAENYTTTNTVGNPALPLMRKIISVPLGASVEYQLTNTIRRQISLEEQGVYYPILPYQEPVAKCEDPNQLKFNVNRDFYNGSRSTTENMIQISELGMMRGERLFALDFVPVNYNPATKSLDIVVSTQVDIRFVNADHVSSATLKARTRSVVFESALSSSIWNYPATRTTLLTYPIGYVIITPQSFIPALQPFIDWKTREGYNVNVTTIESIGNSTSSIKSFMQNLWNSATPQNPAPSYLLIVGDVAQVAANSGSTGSHPTDLNYVRLEGTDYMPEMYFGRFSATTPAEVTNQVNKTLQHEQYSMPDDSYLQEAVLIAGMDSYYAQTHGNGQINYATQNYFNAAHGINTHAYLYPNSGSNAANIRADVSAGAGYVNYTAHGGETNWSDPSFTIPHINALQNQNKYSFVVGNCCLTSKFDVGICFAEGWLRAENKGGVIYIGGTNSTYWNEDYWWGVGAKGNATGNAPAYNANALGVYDAVFHDNNEAFSDWAYSAGAMTVMGNLAVVQGNSTRINYYWEIYSVMGDPSLMPYIGIPAQNSTQVPETLFLGLSSLEITTDPYSYVALSMNNVLHGSGLADADGNLTLEFTPFTEPGAADLVVTRSRRKPLVTTVSVIPNSGPYVTVGQIVLGDDNGVAEAGESFPINLTFSNVGVLEAQNLSVTVDTDSPWVYFDTDEVTIDNIPSEGQTTVNGIFVMNIDQGTPDQHVAQFTFTVSNGSEQWSSTRSLTINAPDIIIASTSFFDPNNNGAFEAGETINITINIQNIGHMAVESGSLDLILNSDQAILPINSFMIPGLSTGSNLPLSFDLQIASNVVDGTVIPLGVALDMGVQMINHSVLIPIGAVVEGFEAGDLSTFPWQNNSTIPWFVTNTDHQSGSYSVRSGDINDNGSTTLEITLEVGMDSEIKFHAKVSSENNYDFLKFYIDDAEIGSWSGNRPWSQYSYPVSAGSRTFKWTYLKDVSQDSGSDAAWIDDIIFPLSGSGDIPMFYTTTSSIDFEEVHVNTTVSQNLVLRNLGTEELNGLLSLPEEFVLSSMGQDLPDDYYYTVEPNSSKIFTITFNAGDPVPAIESEINITSNDPDLPTLSIPITVTPAVANDDNLNPLVTALKGNFPNPFNPTTTIRFSMKEAGAVKVMVYNLKGQLVKNLVDTELSSGNHQIVWDGRDDRGSSVASGIYLYRMESSNFTATNKMMLMK
ncbi:MAG: C25 family cysteine peptidase [Candidatus Cloacimonetes bacterium]|nr:C25 family cysteine peptidase [Candidatus Cloacimonadota bacterium]MCK9334688.1 C25 family cysteine peptidase [Candidatus Cloacimonadota bacterium]MDD2683087.1 C25 family cysteine peptidase [Candidatus Cloacimonadota bacterium]MDD3097067.1 C25 family cysteine peptidase [Candidatus Cloacimonadota bacterium]MDD4034748.1 C25 family cysteine peptidase [Candidatus Cloacimonadota bacterium]